MKTDREKLIELVHEALEKCNTTLCRECEYMEFNNGSCDLCFEHLAADYLISKGVTIPVRCGECIYMEEAYEKNGFLICPASGMEIMNTDFCSYGERKEE